MRNRSVAQVPCLSPKTKFAPRTSSDDRRYGISSPQFACPPPKKTEILSEGALVRTRVPVSGKPVYHRGSVLFCRTSNSPPIQAKASRLLGTGMPCSIGVVGPILQWLLPGGDRKSTRLNSSHG